MKTTTPKLFFLLATGFLVFGMAPAGTLDPPLPPAPTMVTLQQIFDRLNGGLGVVGVAKTGQTVCWNAAGTIINCTGTGQDGALQKGISASPRFTDNADGTVKDNLTGLIWLKVANCFSTLSWTNALFASNTLSSGSCGLTDGSVSGAWRLPNVRELQTLIDYDHSNPALPFAFPFTGVQSNFYWSSTTVASTLNAAWFVHFFDGYTSFHGKVGMDYVWPVRGGS